jgi:RNA polymerase sigma-70 factor (ECF subfamily)
MCGVADPTEVFMPPSPSASHSIADLLPQARQGDPQALAQLFGGCRNYVSVMAQAHLESRLRAKADASDLVQQTFLDAYRAFAQFRGASEAEWLAWLRQILTHNAADFVRHYQGTEKRRAGKEVRLAPADSSASVPGLEPTAPDETPSQILLRKERELQLADALAQLPPDYAEVIRLRNLLRLPFEEVAQRMDRSCPAVQMLWTRAIRKLREVMAEEPGA